MDDDVYEVIVVTQILLLSNNSLCQKKKKELLKKTSEKENLLRDTVAVKPQRLSLNCDSTQTLKLETKFFYFFLKRT